MEVKHHFEHLIFQALNQGSHQIRLFCLFLFQDVHNHVCLARHFSMHVKKKRKKKKEEEEAEDSSSDAADLVPISISFSPPLSDNQTSINERNNWGAR